ncbi:MAG: hypothetical protein GXO91_03670, partial [FCB group bacterium]|nr:hypothetical protein [FCB group bacterium]
MNKNVLIVMILLFTASMTLSFTGPADNLNLTRTFDSGNYIFNAISVDMENNGMLVSHRLSGHSGMEWPVGTDKYIDFASGIWFAGTVNGEIRTAVAEYGPEFVPGSLGSDPLNEIYRIYNVTESDLDNPWGSPDVIDWPWDEGAPWIDANNDGVYNIDDGDLPEMHGDFMIWYVMNDGDAGTHYNIFGTAPLDLEVSVLQWGYYGLFGDVSLQNIIFTKVLYKNMSDQAI